MIFLFPLWIFISTIVSFGSSNSLEYFDFAFDIAKRSLITENENIILSTVSLTEALMILYEGTSNTSSKLLQTTLKLGEDKAKQREIYMSTKNKLLNSSDPDQKYILNSIVVVNVALKDSYRNIIEEDYRGVVISGHDNKKDLKQIIKEKFNFSNLNFDLPTKKIGGDQVVLEIYSIDEFKHRWHQLFDPALTKPSIFHNENGTDVKMPFMRNTGEYKYRDSKKFAMLQIPYKNQKFSLILLLPNPKESLHSIYDSLNKTTLIDALPTEYQNIDVSMPKFELKTSVSLLKYFNETELADLMHEIHISDMTDDNEGTFYLSETQQNAMFKVDENGTETTSVSYISISRRNLPRMIRVNRPFLLAIYNEELKIFTHLGKIVNLN